MRRKQLYFLLTVLGALVIIYVGLRILQAERGKSEPLGDVLGLKGVSASALDSVTVIGTRDSVRLTRRGGAWRVGRWPADSARLSGLWRAASEAVIAEVVARSPVNHPRLGVTDSAATRVTFWAGTERSVDFLVGGTGPEWQSAYVRRPGADVVYLLRGELASLVRRSLNDWRSTEIARFDPVKADRVLLVTSKDSVTLERDTTWMVAEGRAAPVPADTAAVRRAVETLSRLTSFGFAADSVVDTLRFDRPTARVRVLDDSAKTLAELLVLKHDASYYVKRADRPDVWTLGSFTVEDFLKEPKAFRRGG